MSKESTTIARRQSDGSLVEVLPDGSMRLFADETDWQRPRAMTDAEVEAAASSDPDAQPLTGAEPWKLEEAYGGAYGEEGQHLHAAACQHEGRPHC